MYAERARPYSQASIEVWGLTENPLPEVLELTTIGHRQAWCCRGEGCCHGVHDPPAAVQILSPKQPYLFRIVADYRNEDHDHRGYAVLEVYLVEAFGGLPRAFLRLSLDGNKYTRVFALIADEGSFMVIARQMFEVDDFDFNTSYRACVDDCQRPLMYRCQSPTGVCHRLRHWEAFQVVLEEEARGKSLKE